MKLDFKKISGIFFIALASIAGGILISYLIFTGAGQNLIKSTSESFTEAKELSKRAISSAQDVLGFFAAATSSEKLVSNEETEDKDEVNEVKVSDERSEIRNFIELRKYNLDDKDKAVVADLEDMKLSLYEKGEEVAEIEILSKGRPGSPWETPSGEYQVLYKEESHFSSIGEVYMPSSIQFFGNFFIHGWPYYPNGTPVAEGYSGGCIRLSTEDALEVFRFVENGTPIFVYGSNTEQDASTVRNKGRYIIEENPGVALSSDSYLVADLETGEIIMEKARGQVRPIASVSKLMTALVSLEVVNQYQEMTLSADVIATEGYAGGLSVGERITTGDLLYPLMLESSNDAAEALATYYGRKYFIEQMNNKAKSIGLKSTKFEDASGLSPLNVSSAEDLFLLAQHIYRNKVHIFDVSLLDNYKSGGHVWGNISKFLDYDNYLGGKNGYTDEAGKTVVSLFSLPLAEFEDRKIAVILLSTSDIKRDVDRVLSFLGNYVSYKDSAAASLSGI